MRSTLFLAVSSPQLRRLRRVAVLSSLAIPGLLLMGADGCESKTKLVPMRDGVQLATDTYPLANRTAPTVLFRTPYGRDGMASTAQALNTNGFAAVSQDMRGFGDSQGQFMMFTDDGWGARQDGYDTVEWIATNDWSDGQVCMYGASALSISSLLAAGSTPPSLKCLYVLVGTGNLYYDVAYWGGVLRDEMVTNWLNGLGQTASYEAVVLHDRDDAFWDPVSLQEQYARVNVPVYSVGGWFDIFSQGNLDIFTGAELAGGEGARGTQKLVMGPWSHASVGPTVGELTFPDNSVLEWGDELRWFDYWLKGTENGIDTEAPVRYYLMGDVTQTSPQWNIWKTADFWPVPSTATAYYLQPGGGLSTGQPASGAAPSSYVYDPANPVPTVGGNNLVLASGPYDQRSVEQRSDVLIFETPELTSPLAITGRVRARLWVSTSALDTDFTVKLTDVYPDGRSMLLLDGITRLRFREGYDKEVLAEPGAVYPLEVDLWSTAQVFNVGHRVRVAISSSNASRFKVNPNTGVAQEAEDGTLVEAEQTLYHDASRPSQLILPVVPLP